MSMNSSLELLSMSSLDNSSSENEKNLSLWRRFLVWSKKPNQTSNGRLLLATTVLAIVVFGTVLGLKRLIDEVSHDLCVSNHAQVASFEDMYITIVGNNSEQDILDLRDRMLERMPSGTEDC